MAHLALKVALIAQLKLKQLQIEEERIRAQTKIAAGQMAVNSIQNHQKAKVQQRVKAADIMAAAALNERTQQHKAAQQMMGQEHQAAQAQTQQPKKETKE